jgi:hypothetical protein
LTAAMILKSDPAAAPKIGGVLPTQARSILSAPAASTSGGPNWNVENSTLYGASFR